MSEIFKENQNIIREERVYGKDDHECAGTVGADGH